VRPVKSGLPDKFAKEYRRSFDRKDVGRVAKLIGNVDSVRERKTGLIRDAGLLVLALISVAAASVIGQLATFPNLTSWYAGLVKPTFNPPNWVFAPVWTTLYVLMAFTLWRVLRLRRKTPARRLGLILFYAQLTLNAAWPWMFFAAHSPALGLLNIVPQLAIILATIIVFVRLDRTAAWCMVPLVVWVAFAIVLNFAIWSANT
jgi:benzodiazapine receptor